MSLPDIDTEHEVSNHYKWLIRFFILIAIIGVICYGFYVHSQKWSWENAAQFGDMWGGLNATFSFIVILIMAATLHLQRREMAETRKELATSAEAHEATVQHMNEQAQIMKASAYLSCVSDDLENLYSRLVGERILVSAYDKFVGFDEKKDIKNFLDTSPLKEHIDRQEKWIKRLSDKEKEIPITLSEGQREKLLRDNRKKIHHLKYGLKLLREISFIKEEKQRCSSFLSQFH